MNQKFPIPFDQLSPLFKTSFTVPRRLDIRREGANANSLFYLHRGWACTSTTISTGQRQIAEVHLPAEIIGWSSLAHENTIDEVSALTECHVSTIDIEQFKNLMLSNSEYAITLIRHLCNVNVAIADKLTCFGVKDATAHVAHFIFQMHSRVTNGRSEVLEFDLYMSQQDIAEATGMTAVHINRVLRTFRETRVMTVSKARVRIHDLQLLRKIALVPYKRAERLA